MIDSLSNRRAFLQFAALTWGGIVLSAAVLPAPALSQTIQRGTKMARTPFNFIANFKAKPDQAEELKRILTAMVAPTRAEEGCVNYDLHVHVDDKTRYVLYEGWSSPQALDLHMTLPHFQKMLKELDGVVAERDPEGRPFKATALTMVSDLEQ